MPGYGEGGYGEGLYGGGSSSIGPAWIPSDLVGQDSTRWFDEDHSSFPVITPVYSNTIVIPSYQVLSTLTDFPVRVNLSYLTEGWKAGLKLRGSETLRVKDQDSNEVPIDLVWCDEETGKGDLYFKAPAVRRLVSTYFTIELVLGATAPDVTDPIGRNAVWSDYDIVLMDGDPTNRTGNGNNLSNFKNADAVARWFNLSGTAVPYVKTSNKSTWTIGGSYRTDNVVQASVVSYSSSGPYVVSNRAQFMLDSGTTPGIWNSTDLWMYTGGPTYSTGSVERFNYQHDDLLTRKVYRNGSLANRTMTSARPGALGDRFYVGVSDFNSMTVGVPGATGDGDTAVRGINSAYIPIPLDGLPTGSSSYTLEVLVKPASIGTQAFVDIGRAGSTRQGNTLRMAGTASAPQLVNYWWGADLTLSAPSLAVGSWAYIVATFDGTTRSIYFNASLLGSDTPGLPNVTPAIPRIAGSNNGEPYTGDIDEVAIYNYALSPAQIAAHYAAISGTGYAAQVISDSPVTYYRMDDPDATFCTDSSGNGHHTSYGAPIEPFTGAVNRIYLREGVLSDAWLYTERVSWEDPRALFYVTESAPPPPESDVPVWWDGTELQPAILQGWWDGSVLQPVEASGWWDGSAIQPIVSAT